jgi:hypothetical protein
VSACTNDIYQHSLRWQITTRPSHHFSAWPIPKSTASPPALRTTPPRHHIHVLRIQSVTSSRSAAAHAWVEATRALPHAPPPHARTHTHTHTHAYINTYTCHHTTYISRVHCLSAAACSSTQVQALRLPSGFVSGCGCNGSFTGGVSSC